MQTTKICSKCKIEKPFSEFYTQETGRNHLCAHCKKCKSKIVKQWIFLNLEKWKKIHKDYRILHRERLKKYGNHYRFENHKKDMERKKRWAEIHPQNVRDASKRWRLKNSQNTKDASRRWRLKNPEYIKRRRKKICSTPKGYLNCKMSKSIFKALRDNKAGRRWEKLVGYSVGELHAHLESLFTDDMSWKNMGQWHVDHIVPKSFFIYDKPEDQEFQYCWSLDNFQPLWAKENRQKHTKTMEEWKTYQLKQKGYLL